MRRYRRSVHVGATGTLSVWRQVGDEVQVHDGDEQVPYVKTGDFMWKADGSWHETDDDSRTAAALEIEGIANRLREAAQRLREGHDV